MNKLQHEVNVEVAKANSYGSYDGNGKYWRITYTIKNNPELLKKVLVEILYCGEEIYKNISQKGNLNNTDLRFFNGAVGVFSGDYDTTAYWKGSWLYRGPTLLDVIKKMDKICETDAYTQAKNYKKGGKVI